MRTIESYLQECTDKDAFPGAAWVVGRAETILEQGTTGILGNGLGQVLPDTLYDIASLTKIVASLALMRQFEDGFVRLEDPISHFLPAYKNHPKGDITVFELLTHTSVIPGKLQLYRHAHTREDLLESIRWCNSRADSPGMVAYTSKGYILAGEIISAIDGLVLDQVLQNRVLDPLRMNDTCFNPPASLLSRIAPTENCPWRGRIVCGQVHDENAVVMGGVSGHAGLFSTAADMAKLAAIMLNPAGNSFLQKATIEMMICNYTKGRGENRGLGWMLAGPGSAAGDLMSSRSFGHTGFTGTSIWVDPEYDLYAVLLTNRIHPNRDNEKIFRVRQIFHNLVILRYGSR
jgi:CubicO group peptidase (beta-lactamase class C family)